jgi:hypothetical protein
MQNRWIRVLSNGEIRPYLKQGAFGGWIRDHTLVIGPGRIDRAIDALDHLDVPGLGGSLLDDGHLRWLRPRYRLEQIGIHGADCAYFCGCSCCPWFGSGLCCLVAWSPKK